MAEIDKTHRATRSWALVMAKLHDALSNRQVHPSEAIVLVPFAQLIQEARRAWVVSQNLSASGAIFVPRFESTMNWARGLGGFVPKGGDLRLDAAHDSITARALLRQAGLAEHSAALAPKLMEAAWSLAGVAAAVAPELRVAWGVERAPVLMAGLSDPALAFESAIGRIALAWVSTSAYATDTLFAAEPKLLVVIDGFQTEPLIDALALKLGSRCIRMALQEVPLEVPTGPLRSPRDGEVKIHVATDFEDEAERACACVLSHLAHIPGAAAQIGVVALDRQLVRRMRAILGERGVRIRDETGWKLSTTRACASLMSLLRACRLNASTDHVLDWLKNAPAFSTAAFSPIETNPEVRAGAPGKPANTNGALDGLDVVSQLDQLEHEARKAGLRDWPGAPGQLQGLGESSHQCVEAANRLRSRLQSGRSLIQWLGDLRAVLRDSGQWAALTEDGAGRAVLEALKLPTLPDLPGRALEGEALGIFPEFGVQLTFSEFLAWVEQVVESNNYSPPHPQNAQVVILPLAQLLGRNLDAVVLAGCDASHLPASPEPTGAWTVLQRTALGLPSRAELATAARASWDCALLSPQLDILWRTAEAGERNMPSDFVQALIHGIKLHEAAQSLPGQAPHADGNARAVFADDPRVDIALTANPSHMPRPAGQALPVQRLSASAYDDLRRCPYRFFALRQLQLSEADELDNEVDKRDFGNWLHKVLFHFQTALNRAGAQDRPAQERLINQTAQQATVDLGLSAAEFLPFSAAWPRVRAGYLDWLGDHQQAGHVFAQAEVWKEMRLGPVTLVGKLDRVDRQKDDTLLVMDYKTENQYVTSERIKAGNEDTQLAFYAALFDVDNIAAAYVNVGEKEETKAYPQPDIVMLRSQLADGILEDLQGIAQGQPMPAMGEGFACEYCAARGLCRKDFWT